MSGTVVGLLDADVIEKKAVLIRSAREAIGVPEEPGYVPAKNARYIEVRGMSADDVTRLVRIHGAALTRIFAQIVNGKGEIDVANTAAVIGLMYEHAPEVLTDIIVMASDTPGTQYFDALEVAKRLPIPVQLKIAEDVAELTFMEHGGLGELAQIVIKVMGGVDGLLASVKASLIGSRTFKQPSRSSPRPAGDQPAPSGPS